MSRFYICHYLVVKQFEVQCKVPIGDMLVTLALQTIVAVKILGKCYNFKCALCSFYHLKCFKTFMAIPGGSHPYAHKFCVRSDEFKGLKILLFK